MELKFKIQSHQTAAVQAVIDCFKRQKEAGPSHPIPLYRIDPGVQLNPRYDLEHGFKNNDILVDDSVLLEDIQSVQKRQNLQPSKTLTNFTKPNNQGIHKSVRSSYNPGAKINLDIEMETGTGKTYCYIKTMFEMNKEYGWSKFIVMVPSIAIREGVYNSFQSTRKHFAEYYGKKARFFIYNSRSLHELESFSSDAGINVMIINIQAFNARGQDNRRIYEELDEFQSRRPIDVLCANQPILILDEPQKMEGRATLEALPKFNPLMILRYSATHRTHHCLIHRLDALDAYNRKLVKKIAVHGIRTRGMTGTNAYLFFEGIEISTKAPMARIEMEVKLRSGRIKRQLKRLKCNTDLYEASNGLDQYREHVIYEIDANQDVIEFKDGKRLFVGEATGDVNENDIRRIQIRETIKAHLDKERMLFPKDIKVLSLFFIDEVNKYRDYSQVDEKGDYARIFEREYEMLREEYLSDQMINDEAYRDYLINIDPTSTHNGYFSIDKKGRMTDPNVKKIGIEKGISDDASAYDLILKNKEQLLSLKEPTRFIFSHSALREGWDNPNVFVMCMLKRSDSNISRRQEVGRGLRISVDQRGERNDHPALVHEINVLSIIASESYESFVQGLQTEIADSLSRPRKASKEYFEGKSIRTSEGPLKISPQMATQIYHYLVRHEFIDDAEQITNIYRKAREEGKLPNMGENERYRTQIIDLIDGEFLDYTSPEDGRKAKRNRLNANFKKKEFQELWSRINKKVVYQVAFDSNELICKCIASLNKNLIIPSSEYIITEGEQKDDLSDTVAHESDGFTVTRRKREEGSPVYSPVKYDLVGKIAENSKITRNTSATILSKIEPRIFDQFKYNPERFISESSHIIDKQMASMVIERLIYNEIDECYDIDIFTANQTGQDFSRATAKLKNHVYDFAITDSDIERKFVEELDTSNEVTVYAKMPRGFLIPTPFGDYNPDWAISFKVGDHKYLYFVAETKGSMSSMQLRQLEQSKIDCAKKFFEETCRRIDTGEVKYGVVTNYDDLTDLVKAIVK